MSLTVKNTVWPAFKNANARQRPYKCFFVVLTLMLQTIFQIHSSVFECCPGSYCFSFLILQSDNQLAETGNLLGLAIIHHSQPHICFYCCQTLVFVAWWCSCICRLIWKVCIALPHANNVIYISFNVSTSRLSHHTETNSEHILQSRVCFKSWLAARSICNMK